MLYRRRNGIAPTVIAVIVLLIVVVAGVAAYSLSKSGSTSSTTSTSSAGTTSNISTTSSSSAAVSSSAASSSTGSSTETSCTATTSASTSTLSIIPLLNAYSGMSMTYSATANGLTDNTTGSYTTVYASPTTYKIDLTYTSNGQSTPSTLWILKTGALVAVDEGGQNITGPLSNEIVTAYFAGFAAEASAATQVPSYTSSTYVHSTGTSSVTIGSSKFTVTNYVVNSAGETFAPCGNTPVSLTTYTLSVGTPTGSSTPVVTSMHLAGTETVNGQDVTIDYLITLTSITVR